MPGNIILELDCIIAIKISVSSLELRIHHGLREEILDEFYILLDFFNYL